MDKGEIRNEKGNKTHILQALELHTVVFCRDLYYDWWRN